VTPLEIRIKKEKCDALEALYKRKDANPWPDYDKDPEGFMARARDFIDQAQAIYPNA
jgi:hypothetical protein